MSLSESTKQWIADAFGRGNCFVSSGISYTDPNGNPTSGSTNDVVKTLRMDQNGNSRGPGGEEFRDIPGGSSIGNADLSWIGSHQSGSAQYCAGGSTPAPQPLICEPYATHCYGGHVYQCADDGRSRSLDTRCTHGCETVGGVVRCKSAPTTPTPTPTPTPDVCTSGAKRCNGSYAEVCVNNAWDRTYCPDGCANGECLTSALPDDYEDGSRTETGPLQLTIGYGTECESGSPSVNLMMDKPRAYHNSEPVNYVGVMGIDVHNLHPECYIYVVWEMKMWEGRHTTCPRTTPVAQGMSRFLATVKDTREISPTRIDASGVRSISASMGVPDHFYGPYTICMSLWGNYSRSALLAEIEDAGYTIEMPW